MSNRTQSESLDLFVKIIVGGFIACLVLPPVLVILGPLLLSQTFWMLLGISIGVTALLKSR